MSLFAPDEDRLVELAADEFVVIDAGGITAPSGVDDVSGPVSVVVRGGRIAAIAPDGQVLPEAPTRRVDLRGQVLAPGFVDCQAALRHDNQDPIEDLDLLRAGREAAMLLARGVTAAADTRSGFAPILARAIARGLVRGPHLVSGLGPLVSTVLATPADHGSRIVVDGVDGCRAMVRRQMRDGADLIHVVLDYGIRPTTVVDLGNQLGFSDVEVGAIVEEAHRRGRRVIAQASTIAGWDQALRAGCDVLLLGMVGPDPRLLDRTAAASVAIIPMLPDGQRQDKDGRASRDLAALLPAAAAAGVVIGAASASRPGSASRTPVETARQFRGAGLAWSETLAALSTGGAHALALEGREAWQIGSLADFTILASNPEELQPDALTEDIVLGSVVTVPTP